MLKQDDSPDASIDSSVISYIEHILHHRNLVLHFPNALEGQFIRKRITDSLTFIRAGGHLLILLVSVFFIYVLIYFQDVVSANNYQLVVNSYVPLSMAIFLILYGSRLQAVQQYFYRYMSFLSIIILCIINRLVVQHQDDYGEFVIYHLMVTITLMAFGLRFVLPVLVGILLTVGILTVGYNYYYHFNFNYAKFSNYYTLFSGVIIGLSAISEWRERLAFLQGLLIDYQTDELTRLNGELDRIAHEDALTGIANRRCFDETARKEWDRAIREQQAITVMLLDVDFFKRYNDHYGHDMGDKCLWQVAQTLQQCVMRPSDIAARYGGEEFVILLTNTHTAGGTKVAERILQAIDQLDLPHADSTVAAYVTASIGLTSFIPSPDITLAQMLKHADQALYHAKRRGRHQYVVYQAMSPLTESSLV